MDEVGPLARRGQLSGHPEDPETGRYVDDVLDDDPHIEPFDRPSTALTPEDETLLGVDPYE